jgi:hypothetical protein
VFFGKTVWGRRREPIYIFKTHPHQKEDAPPSCLRTKTCQEIRQQSSYRTPTPCIMLGGELLLMSKGDFWFCILYAVKIS